MADDVRAIDAMALDWAVRTGDAAFADWDAFTAWLEADPRHADRYQAMAADIADVADALPAPPAPVAMPAPLPMRTTRRRWLGGALAASLALVGYGTLALRPQPYAVETAAGITRTVALADGSRIALAGGTRLILDRRDARIATLDRGQALFTIRHDAADPFRLRVGDDELVDLGTVFDVVRTPDELRVAVGEGAVMFNPRAEAVPLPAGRALRVGDGAVTVSTIAPAAVGAWRQGRLEYDGAPLAQVAADLGRVLGLRFTVAPAIAARPFRGTLRLDGLAADPARLAPLLNVRIRPVGDVWEIVPLS